MDTPDCNNQAGQKGKQCTKCGLVFGINSFYRDKQKGDGRRPSCIDCERLSKGRTKRPDPVFAKCDECSISFRTSRRRLEHNTHKIGMFCCWDHMITFMQRSSSKFPARHYRDEILERDENKCALCGRSSETLHVHHIKTRGSGGTDEYHNLITLCAECHATKAHGIEGARYAILFQEYVSQFKRPDYWDAVMEKSVHDRNAIYKKRQKTARAQYLKMKENNKERYDKYRAYMKQRAAKRDEEYRKKYGCSYATFRQRIWKGLTVPELI